MDKPLLGSIAGLIAGTVTGAISFLLYSMGLCKLCLVAIGGGLFSRNMLTKSVPPAWTVLGFVDHFIMSIILGVVLAYILHFTGTDYALLKGLGFGATVWYINIAIVAPLAGYIPKSPQPADLAILLGYHLLFGLLASWVIVKLGNKYRPERKT